MDKKAFFFAMTVCSHRTGAHLGKRCGVVFAGDAEEAARIAWEKYGSDVACQLWVAEIPEEGYDYTIYKSEI